MIVILLRDISHFIVRMSVLTYGTMQKKRLAWFLLCFLTKTVIVLRQCSPIRLFRMKSTTRIILVTILTFLI